MKRFVTYLYAYKDKQKEKNTGYIRVDIRNQRINMLVSIKDASQEKAEGTFYIIVKNVSVHGIPLESLVMEKGQCQAQLSCEYDGDIIGIGIQFENGIYMASCWKDGEEEMIAAAEFFKQEPEGYEVENPEPERYEVENPEPEMLIEEEVVAAAIVEEEIPFEMQPIYQKINLNELSTLPSRYWHFSNNSFLLHGFWNYGYLVLKEDVVENEKRMWLGIPGIFEEPEMVMAAYFGFPAFEALPLEMEKMEIGLKESISSEKKNQQPKAGDFGCWFVAL